MDAQRALTRPEMPLLIQRVCNVLNWSSDTRVTFKQVNFFFKVIEAYG